MLVKRLRYSGAYKMFMWVAKSLANRGHDVTVMTFMTNDVNELPANIKWIKRDDLEKSSLVAKVVAIRKVIKSLHPDISVSFLLDSNVYNILACLGLRTKSVVCERNDPFKPGYKVLRFWKPLFRFADGAVYQLPKVAEFYDNIKVPTAVIPNPVQGTEVRALQIEERSKVVITLGRLDIFQKRQDLLISAFVKFHKACPEYQLHIYGKGPDKSRIENIIKEQNASEYVILKGETTEPQRVSQNAMFFVLSSDFEGIPNALIEAMSIGLPCITTDCRPGGARLLIEDGKNGYIVPVNNVDALADRMEYVAKNMAVANAVGMAAVDISERFAEEKIVGLWEDYLRQLSVS